MTHSNQPSTDDEEDFNLDMDMDMDAIQGAEEPEPAKVKSQQEIYIDDMETILSIKNISSWERGFCTSCVTYLRSKQGCMLSYKQKHVLSELVSKYIGV